MRWNLRALFALVLVGALAGCGSGDDQPAATGDTSTTSTTSTTVPSTTTSTTAPTASCSAGTLTPTDAGAGTDPPDAVTSTRADILDAARACDLDRLEELSLAGDGQFSYSFGATGSEGLADHLRDREADGEEIVRLLVETLRLPHVTEGDLVAWPSAHQETPSEADWDALRPLYGDEQVDAWQAGGSGFLGYRVGISATGDWQFFIAGD